MHEITINIYSYIIKQKLGQVKHYYCSYSEQRKF